MMYKFSLNWRFLFGAFIMLFLYWDKIQTEDFENLWGSSGRQVCGLSNSHQFRPPIASDGAGGVLVTWQDTRSGNRIFAQKLNSAGYQLWASDGVQLGSSASEGNPTICSDGQGGAIVTWDDNRTVGGIVASQINANGVVQWTTVICNASGEQWYPKIISDNAGGAIIAWRDGRDPGWDVYAQRVRSDGTIAWNINGIAISTLSSDQRKPQLTTDDSHGSIITWWDNRYGNWDIFAQKINESGVVQWRENGVVVCSSSKDQYFAYDGDHYYNTRNIIRDGCGGAIIVWQDACWWDYGYGWDVYAQRINDNLPSDPTVAHGWSNKSRMTPLTNNNWYNYPNPYFTWNPATSDYGIVGYAVAFTTDSKDTVNTSVIQADTTFNVVGPLNDNSTYYLKVRAKNNNGFWNIAKTLFIYKYDITPPGTFNLSSPANGNWGSALPMFSWQSSSDVGSGVSHYQLWIDNVLNKDSLSSNYNQTPKSPLSEAFHTWFVKAVDRAGNETKSNQTWSARVDATNPAVFNLISPEDNVWTANLQPMFTWQASSDAGSGLNKYQLFIDGLLKRDNISPTTTSTTPPSALSSADHNWYIVAVDNVNNTQKSNQTWMVRIDNTPPTVFNLISPANDSWTGNTTPTFTWQAATDAGSGLLKYELWIDGVVKIDSIPSNSTSATLDPAKALTKGNHTWYVKAYDKAKNIRQSSSTWTLKVDTIPPSNFSLLLPPDGGFANIPTPNFSWNVITDAGAGVSHYQLWIDGALNLDNITTTTSSPAIPLTEGPHSWFVKAVDKVGNKKQSDQTWTVFGEWNPPQPFDLASPANGAKVSVSQPVLSWHPSRDVGSGILKYQLWIGGLLNRDNISPTDTSATPTS